MIGGKVQNYTITESTVIGKAKFVLAENLSNPVAPYVTWQANMGDDPHAYFWGHYCADKLAAMENYGKRIADEAAYLRSFQQKKEKPEKTPER